MRLTSLRLLRYGPFDDLTVPLNAAPGCINLICAPNGFGKSVLRQAFVDLLYGIAGQSPMGFRYGYPGMRVLATTAQPDGTLLTFGRRKGLGSTWIDAEGAALAAPPAMAAFAHTDARALERLFALDTHRLREGGRDLLANDGAVAEALLAAGGLAGARKLRRSLEARADDIAPQRKLGQRPFFVALDEMQNERRRANAALLKPEAWDRLVAERTAAEQELARHREAARAASREAARLHRIRRVRQPLAAHDAAATWLSENADTPDLPETLGARFAEARQKLAIAEQQHAAEVARCNALRAEHDTIEADPALLGEADVIDGLAERAGAVETALGHIPRREAELAQLRTLLAQRLRRLGSTAAPEQAASLLPTRAAEARARALITTHAARQQAHRTAVKAVRDLQGDIATTQSRLAALPQAAETGALALLLAEIRAAGDPATQHAQQTSRANAATAALATATSQVPYWPSKAAAELRAITTHPQPTYNRAHAALTHAETTLAQCERAAIEAQARDAKASGDLAGLEAAGPIPNRDAVARARAHRDAFWRLIERLAFGGAAPSREELAAFAGTGNVALAYEHAVNAADLLADRRADESALIERATLAAAAAAQARSLLAEAGGELAQAREQAQAARTAWQSLLPAALPPAARLDELGAFLAARSRVLERLEAFETESAALAGLANRHAAWAARLAQILPPTEANDLAPLLALADRTMQTATETARTRTELTATLAERRRQADAAEAATQDAKADLAAWAEDWHGAVATLGRPADETPETTAEILEEVAALGREHAEAEGIANRLSGMRTDNANFTEDVRALCRRLAEPAPQSTDLALAKIRGLRERLAQARNLQTRRATLLSQVDAAGRALEELDRTLHFRTETLNALLQTIGTATPDDAERLIARAAERSARRRTLAEANERLAQDGDSLPLDVLCAEAAAIAPDDVPGATAAAEASMQAAQAASEEAAAKLARLSDSLQGRALDTAYAEAIQARDAAAVRAGRLLGDAITARLAAAMLDHAMRAVEEAGSSEMLARIAAWFRQLTNGVYSRITTQEVNGTMELAMIQAAYPDEAARVSELSEGTRDQLFLALRLASIETHPDTLPFIADDILQSFDDSRAEAALRALVQLSHRTQVIVLTHHRHILDLAARLPADSLHIAEFAR